MKVAFALFDKDGDGAITASELRTVMHSLGFDLDDKMVAKMIDRFDYDGIYYNFWIIDNSHCHCHVIDAWW